MKLRLDVDAAEPVDDSEKIRGTRRFCAALWGFVLAFALAATLLKDPRGMLLSFFAAVVTSVATVATSKLTRDERLECPGVFRLASAIVLAIALFGVTLAFLPHRSEASQITGVFFGLTSFLAYRCVVTRGPSVAVWTVVLAMWTWIPFTFVLFVGHHRHHRVPHWTELASLQSLRAILLMLPVLAIAALVCFEPRRDHVPDARVINR